MPRPQEHPIGYAGQAQPPHCGTEELTGNHTDHKKHHVTYRADHQIVPSEVPSPQIDERLRALRQHAYMYARNDSGTS